MPGTAGDESKAAPLVRSAVVEILKMVVPLASDHTGRAGCEPTGKHSGSDLPQRLSGTAAAAGFVLLKPVLEYVVDCLVEVI